MHQKASLQRTQIACEQKKVNSFRVLLFLQNGLLHLDKCNVKYRKPKRKRARIPLAKKANTLAILRQDPFFQSAFHSAAHGITVLSLEGKFLKANEAFCSMVGYTEAELQEKNFLSITHPEDCAANKAQHTEAVREKIPYLKTEKRYLHKSGAIVSALVIASPVYDKNKKPISMLAQILDISDQKRRELEQRELSEFNKKVLESSLGGIEVFDSGGQCLFANEAAARIVGATRDRLESQNFNTILSWQESGLLDSAKKVLETGESVECCTKMTTTFGKKIALNAKLTRTTISGRNLLILHVTDETEQAKAMQRIQESEETFHALFDFAPYPKFFFDRSGIIDCNHALVKILGAQDKEELIGKNVFSYSPELQVDGKASSEKSSQMAAIAHEEGFHRFEWTHRKTNGEEFLVEVTLKTVQLHGKPVMLTLWRDLTERKQQERVLIQSSKMAALGEMAGGIAHEVNNPLAIIVGKIAQIQKRVADGSIEPSALNLELGKIEKTTYRIAKIVKALRFFSRESENDPMVQSNIREILEDTLELCREKFKHHGVDLKMDLEKADIPLECRPAQISQILMNLLNNAFDAIERTQNPWVQIKVEEDESNLRVSIIDSGCGISESVREKIMTPFFTTKSVGKGTGLGLSISRGIAENHKGSLEYDSKCKNTCFVLVLPKNRKLELKIAA